MLICHCRVVNETAVRAAIEAGARQPDDVARGCGAGSRCGGCIPALLALIEECATSDRRDDRVTSAA